MSRGVVPASAASKPEEFETRIAPAGIAYADGAITGAGWGDVAAKLAAGSVELSCVSPVGWLSDPS